MRAKSRAGTHTHLTINSKCENRATRPDLIILEQRAQDADTFKHRQNDNNNVGKQKSFPNLKLAAVKRAVGYSSCWQSADSAVKGQI